MRIAGCVVALMLTISTLSSARVAGPTRPDFSGTWVIIPSQSLWLDQGQPVNLTVFGERFVAKQTGRTLTIAIENERRFTWVYALDGRASLNAPPGPQGPQPTSSSARWSDSQLIIATRGLAARAGQASSRTRRILKLNEDGTLRVEAPWGRNGAMIASVYARLP